MSHPMQIKARTFAINAHGSQKYGKHPYALHLDAVASLLSPFGETAVTLGYLHDVVEDTSVNLEQVQAEFGEMVASCVALLSDEPGANRRDRKAKTYEKLSTVTGDLQLALTVKAADRLANVMACISDKNEQLLELPSTGSRLWYFGVKINFYVLLMRQDTEGQMKS